MTDYKSWKSSDWSITINNPTELDKEQIKNLVQYKWYRKFTNQIEEASTEHIQGYLKTEYIRFAAIKKALTRAHIEPAKNKNALANYVVKNDDTYKSEGIVVAEQCSIGAVHRAAAKKWNTYEALMAEYREVPDKELDDWKLNQLDLATTDLIRSGVWGVEFIGGNPQTRLVYKKYFLAIMYREYATQGQTRSKTAEDGEAPGSSAEGQECPDSRDSGDIHSGDSEG